MSDTNFNIAVTVKNVYNDSIVDYSPYLSFDFLVEKSVNGTKTWESMGSHLCTEEDWEKFNKNIPGSTNGQNAENYEDTIKHHICLDEPERVKFYNLDEKNYELLGIAVSYCINYVEPDKCKNDTEIEQFVKRSKVDLVYNN